MCYGNYTHYCLFRFIGWLESVGSRVVYELDYKKPQAILYVIPIQSILGKILCFRSVIPAISSTTCTTHFLALPATADRVLAMDAGCGSSTRGLWDGHGPGTCNESRRRCSAVSARSRLEKGSMCTPCIAMFEPCCRRLWPCCNDYARFFLQCIANINFGPNMRLRSVNVVDLRAGKDGAERLLGGGSAKKEVHTPSGFHNIFAAIVTCSIIIINFYVRMLSAC